MPKCFLQETGLKCSPAVTKDMWIWVLFALTACSEPMLIGMRAWWHALNHTPSVYQLTYNIREQIINIAVLCVIVLSLQLQRHCACAVSIREAAVVFHPNLLWLILGKPLTFSCHPETHWKSHMSRASVSISATDAARESNVHENEEIASLQIHQITNLTSSSTHCAER